MEEEGKQHMAEDEALDKFINEILDKKDLSGVDDESRGYLVNDLKTSLLDQINAALVSSMPEDKMVEFNVLLDNRSVDDEQIQQFIVNSGVNAQAVTAKVMLLFRDLYLQTPEQREQMAQGKEA